MDSTLPTTFKCVSCRRYLTADYYHSYRNSKRGVANACRPCVSEYRSFTKKKMFKDYKPLEDKSIIYGLNYQNHNILSKALSKAKPLYCKAFNIVTKDEFVVTIEITETEFNFYLKNPDGLPMDHLTFAKGDPILLEKTFLDYLRRTNLRLEMDEVTMFEAKRLLYYI